MTRALLSNESNRALRDIIAARIRREGPISFRDFMEAALYHPEHGYYTTCDPTLDYQSSPNVHPVFAWCLAGQLAEMWRLLGRPARFDVLECGAGSGRLAADLTRALARIEPELAEALRYRLQDRGYANPTRRAAAHEALERQGVAFEVREIMPEPSSVEGCVLSNELIDAFPVHRVRVEGGRLVELRVGLDGERFVEVLAEPSPAVVCYFHRLALLAGEGCDAEVNLDAPAWMRQAATALRRGYVLTLDYGYAAPELYAPSRRQGTLLTFHRHTSGSEPFERIGRQDMTASVDFTTLLRAGAEAGLASMGLTTQSRFLAAAGIGGALPARPQREDLEAFHALRRAIVELTDPDGLGRIKVLLQGKGAPGPTSGFATDAGDA